MHYEIKKRKALEEIVDDMVIQTISHACESLIFFFLLLYLCFCYNLVEEILRDSTITFKEVKISSNIC